MKDICIVTPDFIGPIKNGGIGTHCLFLAQTLREAGHHITVLYTGTFEAGSATYFRKLYAEQAIDFVPLADTPLPAAQMRTDWFVERSHRVYLYLLSREFDVIHFQDWQANGFHTIQAKRTTSAFESTKLIVTMHSSTEWIREGMREWLSFPLQDARLQWCERYCCRHTDLLVSPSKHMIDWAMARKWELAANRLVAQYPIDHERTVPGAAPKPGHIAFFGRLEERKGLVIFCEGLSQLPATDLRLIERIYFVGKPGETSRGGAYRYIQKVMADLAIPYEIRSDFDSFQARRFIKDSGAVAVIPSLLDNLPFTIIECCCDGIPVIASAVGGIPELLPPEQLFPANPRGVAKMLATILGEPPQSFSTYFDPHRSRQSWLKLTLDNPSPRFVPAAGAESPLPLVSICVPHFNYGRYLPLLIESLLASTYGKFEVIVVDDGSTNDFSREVFDRFAESPPDNRFRFLHKKNGGVGDTRNYAASHAQGEFLVFMDADNLATPTMLERMVFGVEHSDADVLTCHFKVFDAESQPTEETRPEFIYAPIGAAVEVGWAENVFGDANFIVRRKVFEALGGFGTERESSWEDYEFLARLTLRGFKLDVIPIPLFWYRYTPEGFSRNTSIYLNHRRVLRTYSEALPPDLRWLAESVLPAYLYDSPSTVGTRIGIWVGNALNRIVDHLLPPQSTRRERAYRVLQLLAGR